jgi:hypothetical protein
MEMAIKTKAIICVFFMLLGCCNYNANLRQKFLLHSEIAC